MSDVATLVDQKEASLIELLNARATKAQAQRKAAPISGEGEIRIVPKEIINRAAKEQGGNDAKDGQHFLFVPEKDLKAYAYKGYQVQAEDGGMVRNDTDVLVACPTWMYEKELTQNSAISNRMTSSAVKKHHDDMRGNRTASKDETVVAKVGPKRDKPKAT